LPGGSSIESGMADDGNSEETTSGRIRLALPWAMEPALYGGATIRTLGDAARGYAPGEGSRRKGGLRLPRSEATVGPHRALKSDLKNRQSQDRSQP
jgi:hypothetical protein